MRNLKTKLSYAIYIVLGSLFLFGCEKSERKYENKHKIVLAKTITDNGNYLIAFTDGKQATFNFASYSMVDVNDTLVFNCIENFSFNKLNCSFIEVRK